MAEATTTHVVKTNEFALFLKVGGTNEAPEWARVRKQGELKLKYDAEVSEDKFVDESGPKSTVDSYKVSSDGDMQAYHGDKAFDWLDSLRQLRATGEKAETETLKVYMYDSKTVDTKIVYAAERSKAVVTFSDFGGEGGGGKASINYTVTDNGDPTIGTAVIEDGNPTFTATE